MAVEFSDGRVAIATVDRVMVGHWRAPFSHARLGALESIAGRMHQRFGDRIGMLGVFESDAIELSALADEGLRREAARVQAAVSRWVHGGQAIVLEGGGFAVAALRGATLTLQSLSRATQRPVFHADTPSAVAFLAERLGLTPSTASSVAAVAAEIRRS